MQGLNGRIGVLLVIVFGALPGGSAAQQGMLLSPQGGEAAGEEEGGIRDNSFLIEEAYNQDPGVVQHIFNWVPSWERNGPRRENAFDYVFTQEWPVLGQRHQFSYTIPMLYAHEREGGAGTQADGFGDILLNYRLQVLGGEGKDLAFAPRFSVILPTGNKDEGLGTGEVGYQVNLPFSKEFERFATHFNAGATAIPGVEAGVDPALVFAGHTLEGCYVGASVIYFLRPNFHLMLETLALWDEELLPNGQEDHTNELLLNPGFRWALFTEGDTQWVVGLGAPIGLTRNAPDASLFAYMSFEHRIAKKREEGSSRTLDSSGLLFGR